MYALFSDYSRGNVSTESSLVKLVAFRFDWKIVVAVGIFFMKTSSAIVCYLAKQKIVNFMRSDGYSIPDWEIVVGNIGIFF